MLAIRNNIKALNEECLILLVKEIENLDDLNLCKVRLENLVCLRNELLESKDLMLNNISKLSADERKEKWKSLKTMFFIIIP